MITDGKPSCLKEGIKYYKNSFGLDKKIVNKCYNEAAACRRLGIPITTFMIAQDPYLQQFVEEFTRNEQRESIFYGSARFRRDCIYRLREEQEEENVRII